MLDFTSALYLGMEHASRDLAEWPRLTLGKPAALEEVPGSLQAKEELAELTGCQQVLLGASTLHLFCDLFSMLPRRDAAIFIDEAAYPIARWGADRAAVAGTPIHYFKRRDPNALWRAAAAAGARPVIVTDGYCPLTGTSAPLRDYADCAADGDGLLIVDDTQALGIWGQRGSGSLGGICGPGVIVVSSLAKAFGAPLAMLGGSREFVEWFGRNSATMMHCSPPSAAAVAAALRALEWNRREGEALRRRLAERVARFRRQVPGLLAVRSSFPVQPLRLPGSTDARAVFRGLVDRGIRPVLHKDSGGAGPRISFVLTARHRMNEIDHAVELLAETLAHGENQAEERSDHNVVWQS